MVLSEVADQRDGNEVKHDRVDDLVRAEPRFQQARYGAPDCARTDRGKAAQRHEQRGRQVRERDADPRGGKRRNVQLPFRADVEKAAA